MLEGNQADKKLMNSTRTDDELEQRRLSLLSSRWLLPLGVLIVVLLFEAQVPGLPMLTQGEPLWRALGDSSKGQGLNGIFSISAFFDVGYRMFSVLAAIAVAWILVKCTPDAWIRIFQTALNSVLNISRRSFGLILFLLAVGVSLGYFGLVRGFTPRLGDEIAYLFQARLFSQGQLSMLAPRLPDFFDIKLIVDGPRWFSQYPPGHPLFLAPAVALGVPWIIGPLMGAVAVVATWLLGTRLYDERTGRLAGALALIAPYFWYMSGSYLSHSTCLAMGCLTALGLITAIQETGRLSLFAALGAGAALGAAGLVRPLTAVGLALGLGIMTLIGPPDNKGPGRRIRRMAFVIPLFVAGAIAVAALGPLYNLATTGHPLRWGYELAQRSSHQLGFGKRGDLDIDYTPARALFNTRVRWRWLDGGFFTGRHPILGGGFFFWPFPAIALFLAILARGKPTRIDIALVFVIVSLAATYFFYYYLEICWGPRFLYESAFALLLLTARGVIALGETAASCGWTKDRSGTVNSGGVFAAALLIPAIFIAGVHIALPTGATRESLYDPITWPTRRVDVALTRALQKAEISEGLVFIENAGAYYATAWRRMFVDQDTKVTYAKDLGESNQKLIADFGSPYWVASFNDDPRYPAFSIRHVAQDISGEQSAGMK